MIVNFLIFELTVIKMRVKSVRGKKGRVVALLDDTSVLHDENDVGFLNG